MGATPKPVHKAFRAGLEPAVSLPDLAALCDGGLRAAVECALAELPPGAAVGVALSAGADSAMLALHAACAGRERGLSVHCFHVHHGLQAAADQWRAQAHRLAALLQVSCHSVRVEVAVQGRGLEAAARGARYAALAGLARQSGVSHVLLAHHQDDQAETVLLRLLRGAGPEGLAAMAPRSVRDGLIYHRPWLGQPRSGILACAARFAAATGWLPVQDPSNTDVHYARGVVRAELAPVLDVRWPAWRRTLARHARQATELSDWLAEAAARTWAQLDVSEDGRSFSLAAWRALPQAQQAAVLRYWVRRLGLRAPTQARLDDWLRQLRGVHALGHDRNLGLRHDGVWIVVRRGRVGIAETQVE